jgi:RNA polymerase sigma factor (sigma-70 family)
VSSRRLALMLGTFPAAVAEEEPSVATDSHLTSVALTQLLHSLRSDEDLAEALRNGEAEDCVQQIFIDVFRSIGQFDRSRASFKTWLLLFAYNRTLNRRRSLISAGISSTESLEDLMPELLVCTCANEARLHDKLLLKKALRHLQPRQQRTIELTYYEGLTAEEIAMRTGETVRVVRHNLYRGLEKLRRDLCSPDASTGTIVARRLPLSWIVSRSLGSDSVRRLRCRLQMIRR